MIPAFCAAINAGKTPRTDRIFPSSDSSPKKTTSAIESGATVVLADKIAIHIAKSKLDPLFGSQAGESETVTFRFGQISAQFTIAALTRSRDSESAASGRPSNEYMGKPSAISTSTVTTWPSSPSNATDFVCARLIGLRRDIQLCANHRQQLVPRQHLFDSHTPNNRELQANLKLGVACDELFHG